MVSEGFFSRWCDFSVSKHLNDRSSLCMLMTRYVSVGFWWNSTAWHGVFVVVLFYYGVENRASDLQQALPVITWSSLALPCIRPLAPRGAVWARHDGLPHELSPLLPVVCHGLCLCEGFAGPLRDVVKLPLFDIPLIRLPSTVPYSITLVRPSYLVTCPYHFSFPRFTVARRPQYGPIIMLCDGFPHMLVSDSVFVGDVKDLSHACQL